MVKKRKHDNLHKHQQFIEINNVHIFLSRLRRAQRVFSTVDDREESKAREGRVPDTYEVKMYSHKQDSFVRRSFFFVCLFHEFLHRENAYRKYGGESCETMRGMSCLKQREEKKKTRGTKEKASRHRVGKRGVKSIYLSWNSFERMKLLSNAYRFRI